MIGDTGIDRIGAFIVQNGGWWLNEDGTEVDRRLARRTSRRSTYVQDNVDAGSFAKYPASSTPAGAARRSAPAGPR